MNKNSDLYVLTATLWMEARGEGEEGIHAVCNVIINRYRRHTWYSHINGVYSIANTCRKPYQFSCWNAGDQCDTRLPDANTDSPIWALCEQIAERAIEGDLPDITDGATHYYADSIKRPAWADHMTYLCGKGHHLFYREQ